MNLLQPRGALGHPTFSGLALNSPWNPTSPSLTPHYPGMKAVGVLLPGIQQIPTLGHLNPFGTPVSVWDGENPTQGRRIPLEEGEFLSGRSRGLRTRTMP